MENIKTEFLPKECWISPDKAGKPNYKKTNIKENLLALIVSCVTTNFPELENCKETKFSSFQEELKSILQREIQ